MAAGAGTLSVEIERLEVAQRHGAELRYLESVRRCGLNPGAGLDPVLPCIAWQCGLGVTPVFN